MKNDELAATVAAQGERIAALEATLSEMRRRLMPAPSATPKNEEGVRIITGREAGGRSAFIMPSDAELRQLYTIVLNRYPQFQPRVPTNPRWADAEQEEHFAAFVSAFRALGDFGRTDVLDTKHAATFWLDRAEDVLHADGISGGLSLPTFTAALVAHGDILFAPLDRHPYDLAFGLRDVGVGKPASDAWRNVLASGHVLAPTQPPRAASNYDPAPVQIRVGAV